MCENVLFEDYENLHKRMELLTKKVDSLTNLLINFHEDHKQQLDQLIGINSVPKNTSASFSTNPFEQLPDDIFIEKPLKSSFNLESPFMETRWPTDKMVKECKRRSERKYFG